jgi:PAS domain S-box-containing protein
MKEGDRTEQLLDSEPTALRQRVADLEALEAEHARTEAILKGERDLLSAVLDTVGALVVVLDPEGRIIRFNRACERTTGYSFAEVGGEFLWDFLLIPEEIEAVKAVIKELQAGQFPNQHENFWVARDGARRLIAWSNTALLDDVGSVGYVVGTGIDVTERKETEEALYRLSRAVEQSPSTVVITDTEGRIEYANPKFTELTGYVANEVLGLTPRVLKSGEHAPEFYQELWQAIAAGGEWRGEFVNRKRNGEFYWELASISPIRDAQGVTTHYVKVAEDITARKQTEEALQREVEVNGAVAELSSALLSPTSLEGVSHLVLEHAKRLTGSQFGYVGYIEPGTGHLVSPTMTRDIWEACQVEDKELVFREFGGLWGWVLNHREPLLTNAPSADSRSSGIPVGHLPIRRFLSAPALVGDRLVGQVSLANASHDYTERDRILVERLAALYAIAVQRQWAEEELRQRTAELQARNEELDAFAHTVAHDLQNPLGLIVGFAELLERDYASTSDQDLGKHLHIIARNGRKMNNIIAELLLLAGVRKVDAEMMPLDMVSVVVGAQQRLADMIEEHRAEIALPHAWPVARGYPPWIEEVWVNYLSNAIRYGGQPPRVELGARVQPDGMVCFWVRDNGVGLTREEQTRLFTPFTQLDQTRAEGHGLGLSIVRRIVEKLGGQVGVESEGVPGRGSVFTFTLPSTGAEA